MLTADLGFNCSSWLFVDKPESPTSRSITITLCIYKVAQRGIRERLAELSWNSRQVGSKLPNLPIRMNELVTKHH
jgi:hypothetical protein